MAFFAAPGFAAYFCFGFMRCLPLFYAAAPALLFCLARVWWCRFSGGGVDLGRLRFFGLSRGLGGACSLNFWQEVCNNVAQRDIPAGSFVLPYYLRRERKRR
ncbi:hypothetical protein HHJ78_05270 [Mobiluncus mulieris]|uniref:Uncharacterized protein n=1 Tax=Mobiluncus mulieris TaxID=2052 RepID=A0A7Y0Y411_9ACTO|nr:hypothetical protein [Mobiluncus mulieris]